MSNGDGNNTAYLYAVSDGISQKDVVSQSSVGSNFDAQRDLMAGDPEYGKLSVDVIVKDGNLEMGIIEPSAGNTWIVWDNFTLTYKGAVPSGIEGLASEKNGASASGLYDILGRKANHVVKGIYIRNGKKSVIR